MSHSRRAVPQVQANDADRTRPGPYPLLLVLLLLLVYAPLAMHPTWFPYPRGGQATDLTITHWPAMAYNARSLQEDGQIPLWRTTIAGGGPWIANPQSWLTYPPAWLSLALPPVVASNILLIAHLMLAALGTYALARRALGLQPPGAALAGLAFAAAPWVSGHLAAGHVNIILALAWLPVALNTLYRVAREGRVASALLTGVAWAAAFVNHIQTALLVVALSTAWFLFVLPRGARPVGWKRHAWLALTVPLVAALLSAVLLLPLAEALPYLNRTELSVEEAGVFSLDWPQLLTALIPTYGGEPEQLIYLGLPILLLAATGLVLRRGAATWFLLAAAAVAVLFALGIHAPLFPLLARLVPGLGWLRVPPRIWMVVALAVALLAGRGLDALVHSHLDRAGGRRASLLALLALVIGLTLALGLSLLQKPVPPAVISLAALTVLGVAAVLLRTRDKLRPGVFAGVMLVLTAVDLGTVRQVWIEMVPAEEAFAWGAPAAAYLADQPGLFRTYSPDYSLPQHIAVENELYLADGVDPIQLRSYAQFLAAAGGYEAAGYSPSLPPVHSDRAAQPNTRLLGQLNVRYVAAGYAIQADGLALRTQAGSTYIYENEHALSRAVVMRGGDLSNAAAAGPATVITYTANEIVVEAETEEPGWLVLSEVCYPGWQAEVDGVSVPVQCRDGLFRSVAIDAGRHTVVLKYSPWSVWLGLVVSGVTLAGLLLYAGYQAWRSR